MSKKKDKVVDREEVEPKSRRVISESSVSSPTKFKSLLEKIDEVILGYFEKDDNLDFTTKAMMSGELRVLIEPVVVDCIKEREKAIQNDKNLSLSTINIPSSKVIEEAVKDIVRKIYEEIERIDKRFFGDAKLLVKKDGFLKRRLNKNGL